MLQKGVIGLICILAGVIGYLVFGGIGLAVGPLTGLVTVADCYLRKRQHCSRSAGPARFRLWRREPHRAARRNRARLEALLAKAHRLADTFHDAYGARNCCLDIIRQTDKEDPLFIAAYELFMSTVTRRADKPAPSTDQPVSNRRRIGPQTDHRNDAQVIRFPHHVSRQ